MFFTFKTHHFKISRLLVLILAAWFFFGCAIKLRNFVETAYFYITMHCVESKFRQSISRMISPGDRILAAVSGGADSLVMLHLLNKLRLESSGFSLAIAHLNHLARGAESKRDADFVMQLGKNLDIETYVEETAHFISLALPPMLTFLCYKFFFNIKYFIFVIF